MKILDIGVCVDNLDPKGIGRIRYTPFGKLGSEIKGGVDFKEWSDNDPFVAMPFLPIHINVIPQKNQSVKIIHYNTSKVGQNVEYISGPYTSPHNPQSQTYSAQHKYTTFGGVIVKDGKNIRNKDGVLTNAISKGSVVDEKDTAFKGNYGSDVIFTENGVSIRGGYLYGKETNKPNLNDYPQFAKKMAKLHLKKFSKTFRPVQETTTVDKVVTSSLNYLVEYEIDNLASPTELRVFVYQVLSNFGSKYSTDRFTMDTVIDTGNTRELKLINNSGVLGEPTFSIAVSGDTQTAYIECREKIYEMDRDGLTVIDLNFPSGHIYPYYFRPTTSFRINKPVDDTEKITKETFMSKVEVRKRKGYGLIFSRTETDPPRSSSIKTINQVRESKGEGEQSFSNLSADKIYLTSTSPNIGTNVKSINFNEIDPYEPTQEDYLRVIEPNTYAMVRGEILYGFIEGIMNLMDSHRHNINDTLVKTDENWVRLNALMQTLKDDLLNNSIRIN